MPIRVLLDTNILIHREAATIVRDEIGVLFNWLDRLGHVKCIHPKSASEIDKHQDERVRRTFKAKLASYVQLRTTAPLSPEIQALAVADASDNDRIDTLLLNELHAKRVDILFTEDRNIANKAARIGLSAQTFTIESFLEKVSAENPELADYKVLAVRRELFGTIDVRDAFFDSFRQDYGGHAFDEWFNRKSDESAYVCRDAGQLIAFLYVKIEGPSENYSDVRPQFTRGKKRLKIGTFKVEMNGFKLGERFLKIVFDNAVVQRADEIYVTSFDRLVSQKRLIALLEYFGFYNHGTKNNPYGDETVYVRDMTRRSDTKHPRKTFPYVSTSSRAFLVPIYPEYHTSLLPDSILRTESPDDFVEQEPHRNAIRKVYVSRSAFRDLSAGDVIVFYRTGGYHKSVVTTIGIVDDVHRNVRNEEDFVALCRRRSVFTDDQLRAQWNYCRNDRPFIVGFLYAYSLPKRPTMKDLIGSGVIKDVHSAPRGFEQITTDQFKTVLRLSQTDTRFVVD